MTGHSPKKRWIILSTAAVFIGFIGFCLVTAVAVAAGYGLYNSSLPPKPVIIIDSPRSGGKVELGQRVEVHADIRDEDKVIRAELWVDGELLEVRTSQLTGGISPFPFLIYWIPSNQGANTLTVRAFNSNKEHNSASIQVNVEQSQDSEGDGVTDLVDLCPDLPGYPGTNGCPDCDGDDIADSIDLCPKEAGLPENSGCPLPTDQDLDGDSVLDEFDLCLDTAGSVNAGGCLDSDCDSLADEDDECPTEPGLETFCMLRSRTNLAGRPAN